MTAPATYRRPTCGRERDRLSELRAHLVEHDRPRARRAHCEPDRPAFRPPRPPAAGVELESAIQSLPVSELEHLAALVEVELSERGQDGCR
jgi:hypothetical protein